ncbi:FAD-binding oxidoreductase [Saccharophagus degradans]|uniref:FAD-binding oxidoreductase n=1 Tax=Saccharophagus degradans TaxID=86304 RepID=UPI002477CF7F|nr:FAD-binding oxidoreductase [Saccharophagus degradans]WGO98053.1 FAD-binding oxidoreductase [Saccharophagus degradans]
MISRRKFLTIGGATLLAPSLLQGCISKQSAKLPESAWQALARELGTNGSGTLVLPSAPSYSSLALPRNISYAHIRPQAVAVCTSSRNVQSAIKWAAAHGISPVPRSAAGHSYAGYSTTTGLSLDMAPLNRVKFLGASPTTGDELVKIGAGARLGVVSNKLAERGLLLPIGRCATVGVAGLTLGGGFGFNSRKFGMTCDSLVETEIVVASGERLVCNERENADLFWATRGGNGGTFGVNTSFTFKTQRSMENISVYRLRWELPLKNKEAVAKVWGALQTAAADAPNDFSLRIGLDYTPNGTIQIEGLGQYRGELAPLKEILTPALSTQPNYQYIRTLDFASAGRYLGSLGAPNAFYCKSAFTDNDFNDSAMNTAINWLEELPSTTKSGSLTFFRWGGAIEDTAPQATAFVHRKAQYVLEGTVCWRPGDEKSVIDNSRAWLQEGFDKRLTNEFNGYAFQNFIDRNLQNWETAYYGENYSRLSQVKSKHDPANLFNNAQSIRPA